MKRMKEKRKVRKKRKIKNKEINLIPKEVY